MRSGGWGSPTPSLIVCNIACGTDATASGLNNSTALGSEATASGSHSTAIGAQSDASGKLDSTAVGYFANATASGATAIGGGGGSTAAASASGEFSIAIGGGDANGANASATNAIAIGQGSSAMAENSAAFGAGAAATLVGQQVFGTSRNTYTMPGIGSAASTAAQSGPLGLVTTDLGGNLASDTGLYNQIGKNREGVAMAMAMGDFWVPENKSMAAGFNVATWDGAWAFAGDIGGKVNDHLHLTGGISVSETGLVGGRAGGVFSW